jgi:hypothetical protein
MSPGLLWFWGRRLTREGFLEKGVDHSFFARCWDWQEMDGCNWVTLLPDCKALVGSDQVASTPHQVSSGNCREDNVESSEALSRVPWLTRMSLPVPGLEEKACLRSPDFSSSLLEMEPRLHFSAISWFPPHLSTVTLISFLSAWLLSTLYSQWLPEPFSHNWKNPFLASSYIMMKAKSRHGLASAQLSFILWSCAASCLVVFPDDGPLHMGCFCY